MKLWTPFGLLSDEKNERVSPTMGNPVCPGTTIPRPSFLFPFLLKFIKKKKTTIIRGKITWRATNFHISAIFSSDRFLYAHYTWSIIYANILVKSSCLGVPMGSNIIYLLAVMLAASEYTCTTKKQSLIQLRTLPLH